MRAYTTSSRTQSQKCKTQISKTDADYLMIKLFTIHEHGHHGYKDITDIKETKGWNKIAKHCVISSFLVSLAFCRSLSH